MPPEPSLEQSPGHLFEQLRGFKKPPLAAWHPRDVLDIDLRIKTDGSWHYRGSPIERQRIVKLFASVLRREPDGQHCLITPRLKYPVAVDGAPFQAVELKRQGAGRAQNLVFRTNVDDVVLAGRHHPIEVAIDPVSGQPFPWVEVRDGLRAKICRSVYYELAQILEAADIDTLESSAEVDADMLGVYSDGVFFPFGRAS